MYFVSGEFGTLSMFQVLRDCDSGICRGADHEFPTAGSQVCENYMLYIKFVTVKKYFIFLLSKQH